MKSGPNLPIRFFSCLFSGLRFYGFFFNICGQHCLYSLNYSVARPGAGEAYWLIYIILHFSFRAHRFMLNKTWKLKVSCSLLFFEMTAEMNEIITWETFLPRRYLKKGVVSVMGGFLSNDNGKKKPVKKQNNITARASPFIVHLFAVVAQLRRETS